ncbi:hypothetical protein K6U27_11620 [Vibrio fluvialis]|uniref:hypothetical protein n=1 Tax=Vibrio fluvialis TaxID=676 RepID=UPI001EE9E7B0|nr:hypothetical protein [Vibrio fluvialis]MCG6373314.1 hypothetical protein [Vibrio fluvialis]
MIGFSIETCIGMILALFLILIVSPAGIKKTSEQVISAQVAYGGGYLALSLGLLNVVVYTWLYPNGVLYSGWVFETFMNFWSAIISSLIGAVYWVFLCLYVVRGIKNTAGKVSLAFWPLFMFFQNYLPKFYGIGVSQTELIALREPVTDWIATGLIAFVVVGFSYAYWANKYRWVKL